MLGRRANALHRVHLEIWLERVAHHRRAHRREGLDQLADLKGIVIFRVVDGKKMGARFDIKAIRAGSAADPLVYGDDIIVVDQSGSKTAFKRLMESLPVFNMFTIL